MSVVPHTGSVPSVSSGRAVHWLSPLAPLDVEGVLRQLGAEAAGGRRPPRWVLASGEEPFRSALSLEASADGCGTRLCVSVSQQGFGRDFDLVVRGALTLFAVCLVGYAAAVSSGLPLVRTCAAIGLGWASLMGSYAGLRWLMAVAGGDQAALDAACVRVQRALFVQRRG